MYDYDKSKICEGCRLTEIVKMKRYDYCKKQNVHSKLWQYILHIASFKNIFMIYKSLKSDYTQTNNAQKNNKYFNSTPVALFLQNFFQVSIVFMSPIKITNERPYFLWLWIHSQSWMFHAIPCIKTFLKVNRV